MASVYDLSPKDIGLIKLRLNRGELQHRIAADFDLNPGRISEINTGKRFSDVPPATMQENDAHAR